MENKDNLKILICSQNESLSKYLKTYFEQDGVFNIDVASNIHEIYFGLTNFKYTIIFCLDTIFNGVDLDRKSKLINEDNINKFSLFVFNKQRENTPSLVYPDCSGAIYLKVREFKPTGNEVLDLQLKIKSTVDYIFSTIENSDFLALPFVNPNTCLTQVQKLFMRNNIEQEKLKGNTI